MRWTQHHLYFLFICQYEHLHLRREAAKLDDSTAGLWKWDVAEVFVGADEAVLSKYYEFEVSPRGEWLNLEIDCSHSDAFRKTLLQSESTVGARIDQSEKTWFGFLRIPYKVLSPRRFEQGQRFRINFFRSQGNPATEVVWRPTYSDTFHVPAAFGYLSLTE